MSSLDQQVIYDHPADYPEHFVRRAFRVEDGQVWAGRARLFDTLEEARQVPLERGMYRMERSPDDDPVILETWI